VNAEKIVEQLNILRGVSEVVYRAEVFRLIDRYIGILAIAALVIGVLILLGSLFVISNTIRIIINSKRSIINTMKLVGATPAFIRRPFLVEGMLQGIAGGGIAAMVIFVFANWSQIEMPGLIQIDKEVYGILLLIGLIFGWLGSLSAVKRLLRY
jgi:cell division transport system permease protein